MNRVMLFKGNGLTEKAGPGSGIFHAAVYLAGDAAATLTPSQLAGGAIYGVVTAGRAYTMPTAAALTAAFPDMAPGESFGFYLGASGGTVTITTNTGITLNGYVAVATLTSAYCLVVKVSDTAYTVYCF